MHRRIAPRNLCLPCLLSCLPCLALPSEDRAAQPQPGGLSPSAKASPPPISEAAPHEHRGLELLEYLQDP